MPLVVSVTVGDGDCANVGAGVTVLNVAVVAILSLPRLFSTCDVKEPAGSVGSAGLYRIIEQTDLCSLMNRRKRKQVRSQRELVKGEHGTVR